MMDLVNEDRQNKMWMKREQMKGSGVNVDG